MRDAARGGFSSCMPESALKPAPTGRRFAAARRELQQQVEEGVETLLQAQAARGADAEAAALQGLRHELRRVQDAVRLEREQFGGVAVDVTARTVRCCRVHARGRSVPARPR